MAYRQDDVLRMIKSGISAEDQLTDIDAKFEKDFFKLCRSMATYLERVKVHFPDAEYYTASGGFTLMLGKSHNDDGRSQSQLVALSGSSIVSVGDGDF